MNEVNEIVKQIVRWAPAALVLLRQLVTEACNSTSPEEYLRRKLKGESAQKGAEEAARLILDEQAKG